MWYMVHTCYLDYIHLSTVHVHVYTYIRNVDVDRIFK